MQARIIVGVDGSQRALDALLWALQQASVTGRPVDVVTVWLNEMPYGGLPLTMGPGSVAAGAVGVAVPPDLDQSLAAAAQATAEDTVRRAGAARWPGTLRTLTIRGSAGPALSEHAHPDDLLVVGSGSHGPVAGAVLGSVPTYLITHAPCPVVVVPGKAE